MIGCGKRDPRKGQQPFRPTPSKGRGPYNQVEAAIDLCRTLAFRSEIRNRHCYTTVAKFKLVLKNILSKTFHNPLICGNIEPLSSYMKVLYHQQIDCVPFDSLIFPEKWRARICIREVQL